MKLTKSGATLALAAAALLTTTTLPASTPAFAANVKCFGINECRGHGSNTCRGQGVVLTTAANCKAKGGKVVG